MRQKYGSDVLNGRRHPRLCVASRMHCKRLATYMAAVADSSLSFVSCSPCFIGPGRGSGAGGTVLVASWGRTYDAMFQMSSVCVLTSHVLLFAAVDERLDAPFSFFVHAVKLGLALSAAVVMVTVYHS